MSLQHSKSHDNDLIFTVIVKDDGASGASGAGKGTGGGMAALKAKQRLASKGCHFRLSWENYLFAQVAEDLAYNLRFATNQ